MMRPEAKRTRVVITGVGVISPIGTSFEAFRARMRSGESGIGEVDLYDVRHAPSPAGGQVRGFDLRRAAPRALAERVRALGDRRSEFGCGALLLAWDDARLAGAYDPQRIAVSLGTGAASYHLGEFDDVVGRIRRGRRSGADLLETARRRRSAADAGAERHFVDSALHATSDALGIAGPRSTHLSTCAASAISVGLGLQMVRSGAVDACLAGGYDSFLSPNGVASFTLLGAHSAADRPPAELMKPFDRHRDGMVIGEGAAILVLERLESARARGAQVLAEVCGAGASMDATSVLAPHPEGEGAAKALRAALRSAGVAAADVDYINAHGTATSLNDVAETRAIKAVFGERAYEIPVSSSKPMFGHLIGASGAVEILATLAALTDQFVPPTLNLHDPDPDCDLDYVPLRGRPARIRRALSNSFGFGGYNASVVLAEAR
jgi:3-oxoacyl-[acyl-carrier-protein] synthase II